MGTNQCIWDLYFSSYCMTFSINIYTSVYPKMHPQGVHYNSAVIINYKELAIEIISAKDAGFKEAPPTRPPSISGIDNSSFVF